MVRKTLWLHADEAEALRERAFWTRLSASEILREGLRRVLRLRAPSRSRAPEPLTRFHNFHLQELNGFLLQYVYLLPTRHAERPRVGLFV